jgi:hypothetical protein
MVITMATVIATAQLQRRIQPFKRMPNRVARHVTPATGFAAPPSCKEEVIGNTPGFCPASVTFRAAWG